MADNTFDSEELDIQFQPITAYIDGDGSFKLNTPMLSSLDFDGSIPKVEDEALPVTDVMPGFFIKLEEDGDYFVVESVEVDEEFIDSTGLVTINYIDDQGQIVSVDYDDTDTVHVMYEDWAEKILGTRGWGITSGGNAIFTNVAVRGRIEATEGYIDSSLVVGSGGSIVVGDFTTEADVNVFVNDLNDRISASIDGVVVTVESLSASVIDLYEAGFVKIEDLITTGGTSINGNNITTGILDVNLVSVKTEPYLANRGVQITALGLEGFNSSGTRTFFLNTSGVLTLGAGSAFLEDYPTYTNLSTSGQTIINGGNISTGTINASLITTGTLNASLANITNIDASNINAGTLTGRTVRTSDGSTRAELVGGAAGELDFYYFGALKGFITAYDVGLSLFGFPAVRSWSDFEVVGDIDATTVHFGTSGGSNAFRIDSSGNVYSYGIDANTTSNAANVRVGANATLLKSTSTQNVKTNIVSLDNDLSGVDQSKISKAPPTIDPYKVLDICSVEYTSLCPEDSNARFLGFISEDVYNKFPVAADLNDDGKPQSVQDRPIISALLFIVKKQEKKITDLESRVVELSKLLS